VCVCVVLYVIAALNFFHRCKVVASLCEGAHRVSVTEQCCACGSRLVQVDFNKVPSSMYFTHLRIYSQGPY